MYVLVYILAFVEKISFNLLNDYEHVRSSLSDLSLQVRILKVFLWHSIYGSTS